MMARATFQSVEPGPGFSSDQSVDFTKLVPSSDRLNSWSTPVVPFVPDRPFTMMSYSAIRRSGFGGLANASMAPFPFASPMR